MQTCGSATEFAPECFKDKQIRALHQCANHVPAVPKETDASDYLQVFNGAALER
jgi:hypothetical protein